MNHVQVSRGMRCHVFSLTATKLTVYGWCPEKLLPLCRYACSTPFAAIGQLLTYFAWKDIATWRQKKCICFICLPMLNITASETDCYPRSHCKIGIIVLPFLSVPLYNPIIFCCIFEILQQYVLLIYPSVFLFRIIISYLVCDPTLFRFSPVDNEVELLQRFFS